MMRSWQGERKWKQEFEGNWWIWPLIAFGAFMLIAQSGWWWLLFFWWVVPMFFGGWSHHGRSHMRERWAGRWAERGAPCGGMFGDDAPHKRKHGMDDEKPKRDAVYIYREDGEVLKVTDAPDKPKRGEYV
jgi:hypothetical protein